MDIRDPPTEKQRPADPPDELPDSPVPTWGRRGDLLALATALALIGFSVLAGRRLLRQGVPLVLPEPPLLAAWDPHLGWGTPLAGLCVLVGLRLRRQARVLPWRQLLVLGWLLSLAWMCSLTLIDGIREGWIGVLLDPNEYLEDLPRITSPAAFLATFTDFIAFSDTVDGDQVWTTHVAGHPPLATLVFWGLARTGLSGGFWAGALCILASSVVSVALPVTLRELGAGSAARRIVAFVALFPGAVWMAVSADGLFAGVALSGLALVCRGAARGRLGASLAGGVLLGATVFLSYGLVLFGLVVLLAVGLTVRRRGLRRSMAPWLVAVAGVVAVAAIHLAYGFDWGRGLGQLRIRYYQGIASDRPFSYFLYANLAAWLISCSPLLAVGVARAVGVLARGRCWSPDRVVALVVLAGVLTALLANLSGLSKAEVERIWLTFGVVGYAGLALLRGRAAGWALLGGSGWALLINHLLDTGW